MINKTLGWASYSGCDFVWRLFGLASLTSRDLVPEIGNQRGFPQSHAVQVAADMRSFHLVSSLGAYVSESTARIFRDRASIVNGLEIRSTSRSSVPL